jgi:hypothetical protein
LGRRAARHRELVFGLGLGLGLVSFGGCSSDARSPSAPLVNIAGSGSGRGGSRATGGDGSAGVPLAGEGGVALGGDGSGGERATGLAGHDSSGGDESLPEGGAGQPAGGSAPIDPGPQPDPFPCASDTATAPSFQAVCKPDVEWAPGAAADVTVGPNASLLGITPDELTMVWLEPESSQVVYLVADRSSPDSAFGEPQRLPGESVLAVSPDGLRLVVLSDDQGALLERARADRGQAFGARSEGEFASLNADALAQGYGFSSCALSPDGLELFYTVSGIDEPNPLRESRRSQPGPWPVGTALETCELEAHSGVGRYPTGVSADGKTLFFYDAWRNVARAAWRETNQGPFTWFRDLGDWRQVQANLACDLYYSAPDAAAPILVSVAP